MSIVIGMLAHVDAGKTTLSEQILYRTKSIRVRGRVDHKDAYLDSHPIERERGITVFSGQAPFTYRGRRFYLLDTPGHVDFSAEMERALFAVDYAVLVVSCVEGVQGHTETIWELLRKNRIPTLFFLNKTDRPGADISRVIKELQKTCSPGCILFTGHFQDGEFDGPLAERLAEMDDTLMERYVEDGFCREQWLRRARSMVRERSLFPCFSGSALNDEGVKEFLDALALLTEEERPQEKEPFSGLVYQVRHDRTGSKLSFVRVFSGALRAKDTVCVQNENGEPVFEKVNELRQYNGEKAIPLPKAEAGDLCAVVGLASVRAGDRVGSRPSRSAGELQPLLTARVLFGEKLPASTVLRAFRLLEEEQPELSIEWEEELQEIHVHVMGRIQLEILERIVPQRFGFEITFGPCETVYRETIASPVIGYGHFEPLRHYAEVHLKLEPGPRGSGITFASACPTDVLESHYQNLIRTHVFEKEHRGILTGAPLTDVKITLLTGRAHEKHTEGGDFRQAVRRAVRQGLEQAENILLEPYYAFSISAPANSAGRILSDIQRRHGVFDPPRTIGDRVTVTGRGPVSEFFDYSTELSAQTKGAASMGVQFAGYEPCHNASDAILRRGYEKDRDTANPSSSIFCSHGAGFPVKWDEVEQYIHCRPE